MKYKISSFVKSLIIIWAAIAMVTVQLSLAEAAPYYKGKMIKIYTSVSPGGGFDTFARLLARHLGEHIPGNPRTIVINMPGGGHLIAANRIYAMPGDGLTMVNFHYGKVAQAFLKDPAVKFDPLKYHWLGDPTLGGLPQVMWLRSDLGIKSLAEVKSSKEKLTFGSTGMGTSPHTYIAFLKTLGYPVKNIAGYQGSALTFAALERNELHGRVISQNSMQTIYRRFLKRKFFVPILAIGDEPRLKAIKGIATLKDLKLNSAQAELAEFIIKTWALLRVYAIPPKTPMDRVQILRNAFMMALKNPKLIKDAKRQGVFVSPKSGREVEGIVKRLHKITQNNPGILNQYKKLVGVK